MSQRQGQTGSDEYSTLDQAISITAPGTNYNMGPSLSVDQDIGTVDEPRTATDGICGDDADC